jgi:hypothetical protein
MSTIREKYEHFLETKTAKRETDPILRNMQKQEKRRAKWELQSSLPYCTIHGHDHHYWAYRDSNGEWLAKCRECIRELADLMADIAPPVCSDPNDDMDPATRYARDIEFSTKLMVDMKCSVAQSITKMDEPFLEPELKKLVLDGADREKLADFIRKTTSRRIYTWRN